MAFARSGDGTKPEPVGPEYHLLVVIVSTSSTVVVDASTGGGGRVVALGGRVVVDHDGVGREGLGGGRVLELPAGWEGGKVWLTLWGGNLISINGVGFLAGGLENRP